MRKKYINVTKVTTKHTKWPKGGNKSKKQAVGCSSGLNHYLLGMAFIIDTFQINRKSRKVPKPETIPSPKPEQPKRRKSSYHTTEKPLVTESQGKPWMAKVLIHGTGLIFLSLLKASTEELDPILEPFFRAEPNQTPLGSDL